jgi:hypothetical protein
MSTAPALLACLFALSTAACAAPLQNGGVEVRPGAVARLEVVCRYAGGQGQKLCDVPAEEPSEPSESPPRAAE